MREEKFVILQNYLASESANKKCMYTAGNISSQLSKAPGLCES